MKPSSHPDLINSELTRWIGRYGDTNPAYDSPADVRVLAHVIAVYLYPAASEHHYIYFPWAFQQATRSQIDTQKLGEAWRQVLIDGSLQPQIHSFSELVTSRAPELLSALTEHVLSMFPKRR
ncbi:MAG: hypothetical protein QM758_13320 [Armatimonas sp.]